MIFEISEDLNIVDVILGKAGASKSSSLHPILTKRYGEYERYTSTHSLKRDAMCRYSGVKCATVAGGLFTTLKGQWYTDFRKPTTKCIVIDEVLQCNVQRVIDFVEQYRGQIKIIICTDDKQMLVPHIGAHYLTLFNEFCSRDYVKVTRLTKTLRTIHNGVEDIKLTKIYDDAYDNVDNIKLSLYDKYEKAFPHISYSELLKKRFNPEDFYLTYTNEAEESLYLDFDIKNNAFLEWIPKGNIASDDNIDFSKYAIACQAQAERLNLTSYLQAKNIGTITRMQGREVPTNHKCYIIVPSYCKMTNRAFYTAITRCWSYDSIIFVDYESPKTKTLKSFMGQPIKRWDIKMVPRDEVKDIKMDEEGYITKDTIEKYVNHQDQEDLIWRRDCLRIDGDVHYIDAYKGNKPTTKSTAKNIIKKSPELNFNAIDRVYELIGHFFVMPKTIQNNNKKDFKYQVDLFSAYPHIIAHGLLPVAGRVYDKPYPDKLNYYEVISSDVLEEGSIITHNLAILLTQETNTQVHFLFGTDCTEGCKAGKDLLTKAYKSKEDKVDTKGVHWGLYQRPYLEAVNITYHGEGQENAFGIKSNTEYHIVRNEGNVYEPLFCAIRSDLLFILLALKLKLYNRISANDSFMLVDALYLDEDKTEDIKDFFSNGIKNYRVNPFELDYRIYQADDWDDKGNYKTLYQSYENLKSRKQIADHKYYEKHKKNK